MFRFCNHNSVLTVKYRVCEELFCQALNECYNPGEWPAECNILLSLRSADYQRSIRTRNYNTKNATIRTHIAFQYFWGWQSQYWGETLVLHTVCCMMNFTSYHQLFITKWRWKFLIVALLWSFTVLRVQIHFLGKIRILNALSHMRIFW